MTNSESNTTTSKRQEAPASWEQLLREAVEKEGVLSEAYSRFYRFSVGNQLLARFQQDANRYGPVYINERDGREFCLPEGSYSMCPLINADDDVLRD